MSKVRINDLARELEVKSKAILDVLTEVGVTEKKTHSSSLEEHEAEKVRLHFRGSGESAAAKSVRTARPEPEGIKTKIDLSHISKPGDVLKAIISKQQGAASPVAPPPPVTPSAPQEAGPSAAAPVVKPSAPVTAAPTPTIPPRVVVPSVSPRPAAPAVSAPSAPPSVAAPPPAAPPVAQSSLTSPASAQVIAPRPPGAPP